MEDTRANQLAIQFSLNELNILIAMIHQSKFNGVDIPLMYGILSKLQNYVTALTLEK